MRSFDNIGPIIEHIYLINNYGPFTIDYFKMKFYWPYELNSSSSATMMINNKEHGKHLLYLTEKPIVSFTDC